MTSPGWILLLSGSSSSGKSTLGRALLALADEPCVFIEADAAYPTVNTATVPETEPIVTFHSSVVSWSVSGYSVILDGSLPYQNPGLRRRCLDVLPPDRTVIVGVGCETSELRRRTVSRPEPRPHGWAEQQSVDVNDGLDLLTTVDTTHGTADQHARSVLTALRHCS